MKRIGLLLLLSGVLFVVVRPSAMIPDQVRIDTGGYDPLRVAQSYRQLFAANISPPNTTTFGRSPPPLPATTVTWRIWDAELPAAS